MNGIYVCVFIFIACGHTTKKSRDCMVVNSMPAIHNAVSQAWFCNSCWNNIVHTVYNWLISLVSLNIDVQ